MFRERNYGTNDEMCAACSDRILNLSTLMTKSLRVGDFISRWNIEGEEILYKQ